MRRLVTLTDERIKDRQMEHPVSTHGKMGRIRSPDRALEGAERAVPGNLALALPCNLRLWPKKSVARCFRQLELKRSGLTIRVFKGFWGIAIS